MRRQRGRKNRQLQTLAALHGLSEPRPTAKARETLAGPSGLREEAQMSGQQGSWKLSSSKLSRPHKKPSRPRKRQPSTQKTVTQTPTPPGAHAGNLMAVGGVAGRLWLGETGQSGLVSGRLNLYEGVALPDRDQVEAELKSRLRYELARGYHAQTSMELGPGNPTLDRIEWMVLIGPPDQEAGPRLQAFCEGWSAGLPPGVRARDLTGPDVQKLARRLLGTPLGKKVVSRPPRWEDAPSYQEEEDA